MLKAYYFPPIGRKGYQNPYSSHFRKSLERHYCVTNCRRLPTLLCTLSLFCHAWMDDVFYVGWLENVGVMHWARLQYVLTRWALRVIRLRGKKVVWIYHNIQPHAGGNRISHQVQEMLFAQAQLIVAHSQEAADYIRKRVGERAHYCAHPVTPISFSAYQPREEQSVDLFLWGTVLDYKGVVEFLSSAVVQQSDYRIEVLGRCEDARLEADIRFLCNERIHFDNRRAPMEEIAYKCRHSRKVVFPYVGESISSSGALMDTLVLGDNPVGPHRGAFLDLAALGLCDTYRNEKELAECLHSDWQVAEDTRTQFVQEHGWDAFIDEVHEHLNTLV